MASSLAIQLLGQLTVTVDEAPIELGKGQERLLIALLSLNTSDPVPTERIVDAIWAEDPPATAAEMVRIYVARARKRLGDAAIATLTGAYVLQVEPEAVDVLRFERQCFRGSRLLAAGDRAEAVVALDEALALWRGPPLLGLDSIPFVLGERARLEELRLTALEDRFDALIALGRTGGLVAELEPLVRQEPYRERLRGQLMLALYRSGRQAEALGQYREARTVLVDEVGVEPGAELKALQQAILTQSPSLEADRAAPVESAPHVPAGRSRRRLLLALLALGVVAAAVGTPLAVLGADRGSSTIGPASVGTLDARTGAVSRSVQLGGLPGPVAADAEHVWVGDGDRHSLQELTSGDLRLVRTMPLPDFPYRIDVGRSAIWVANGYRGTVERVDVAAGTEREFRPEPNSTGRIQLSEAYESFWAASQDGVLARLDARSLKPLALIPNIGSPEALGAGSGSIWIGEATRDELIRVDASRNRVVHVIPIGGIAESIASGDGAVWAVTPLEGTLWKVDPETNAVTAAIDVGPRPVAVTVTRTGVWVGSANGTLSRVDPTRDEVAATISLGMPLAGLAAAGQWIWVAVR